MPSRRPARRGPKPSVNASRHACAPLTIGHPLLADSTGLASRRAHPPIDWIDSIGEWNIADGEVARQIEIRLLPGTCPYLVLPFRAAPESSRRFGDQALGQTYDVPVVTHIRSGYVAIRPHDALGAIGVRLKPCAAIALLGDVGDAYGDTKLDLALALPRTDTERLAARLADAADAWSRYRLIVDFLAHLPLRRPIDPLAAEACHRLGKEPSLRVSLLATALSVSERTLARRFLAGTGMGIKRFARLARMETLFKSRRDGERWIDVAQEGGYFDQSHMIDDFTRTVGAPPASVMALRRDSDRPIILIRC
ncbi:hypothetical protein KCV01_g14976, partial [Aureobasidium melanogenum]